MARHNLDRSAPTCRCAGPTRCGRSRATPSWWPIPPGATAGRRRFDPRDYTPALDRLFEVYADRDMVVKCAPGIDFDQLRRIGFAGEVEVTSLAGSGSGGLPVVGGAGRTRRSRGARRSWTAARRSPTPTPTTARWRAAGRWIVDPDGAVVRAGLGAALRCAARALAARPGHRLPDRRRTARRGTGIRGDRARSTFGERVCARRCRRTTRVRLEILVRGVDVDPDALRARLRLRGSQRLALVITRIGAGSASRAVAYVCRPSR